MKSLRTTVVCAFLFSIVSLNLNIHNLSLLLKTTADTLRNEATTTATTNDVDHSYSCNSNIDPLNTSIIVLDTNNYEENITVHGLADRTEYHDDAQWTQSFGNNNLRTPNLPCHHESQRIPVLVFPFCTENDNWEGLRIDSTFFHLFGDGLHQSSVLYRVDQHNTTHVHYLHPNVVWIAATKERQFSARVCRQVTEHIRRVQEIRRTLGLPIQWPVFFTQFTDGSRPNRCMSAEKLMDHVDDDDNAKFVTYVRRSVVTGRRIVNESIIELGSIDLQFTRHSPIPVRTDTLASVQRVLQTLHHQQLWDPIEESIVRPIDVAHFWPPYPRKYHLVGFAAGVRRRTTARLMAWATDHPNITVFCDVVGRDPNKPLTELKEDSFAAKMLQSKIIVATQRDYWEDHYRLMEAMISGAMVIQDTMLSLPSGLQNGTSIIEFRDIHDELPRLLEYYLEHEEERLRIAREGRRVALSLHRSWHEIERIVLGEPRTVCHGEHCPYQVYPQEEGITSTVS